LLRLGSALFIISFCVHFQTSAASFSSGDFAIENWQTDEGLPQNSVTAVFQASNGYIYAGTYNGMARFDGVRFVTYDSANTPALKNSRVTSLFQDDEGTIWIGHETGEVSALRAGVFSRVDLGAEWPAGEIVSFGADEQGENWVLNHDGVLLRLRDRKILKPLPGVANTAPGTPALVRDKQGKLWMTYRGVAAVLERGELSSFRFGATDDGAYFEKICASEDGGLWVVAEQRLRKWNDGQWVRDLGTSPWGQAFVTMMLETHSGQLLVGTLDSGIYILGPAGEVSHLSRTNGLPHDWVRSLAEDKEGNVWVGTSGGGLCVLRAKKVLMFSPPDDWQGRSVLSVTGGRRGEIRAGTEGAGLYELKDGKWSRFDASSGISNPFVWSAFEDSRSNLWIGTWGGGLVRKTATGFAPPPGLEDFSVPVTALMEGFHGEMWVGTTFGLLRYQNGKAGWLTQREPSTLPDVRALAQEPDGTIWFGMNSGGGLGRWRDGQITTFRKRDGLASDFILSLHRDADGTLWIGTLDNGLSRLKNGVFATINSKNGLANDVICSIADDGSGHFWIGSQNGIFRVAKEDLNQCADGRRNSFDCLIYGKRQGLATLACSGGFQPASWRTADGRIWFPTAKGLAAVNPADVNRNVVKPPVLIEAVVVDGKPAKIIHRDGAPDFLNIAPGQQRIQFQYTALSFTSPERVRFKYRLEGLEEDWMEAGTQREINYSYLQPDNYTFRVIACNNDGVWNEEGASLALTVLPRFWQTWWFRTLAYVFVVLGVGGAVLIATRRRLHRKLERVERQRALERERTRIAKDIHDDLGASLTRITMLSQTVRKELEQPQRAAEHLEQIYSAARASTHALDEIVWAVNPKHDSLDSMATYLVKFVQNFVGPAGIRCRLEMPLQLPAWALTAEVRHNLFLAYKEAVNNVVKHAAASEVRVSLSLQPDGFVLGVEDDGRGFKADAKLPETPSEADRAGGGNGLENMRRRMEEIGGVCEIESAPGKGTKVKFVVKLKPMAGS